MKKLIDHVESESLSKFTESAKKILNSKKELALESERVNVASTYMKESMDGEDCDDYTEEDPNFDVDIDPESFDENDMTDLESVIWDDDDLLDDFDEEVELENELNLTYEQLVYALEHFESLDELSKKTLSNYVKKASDDYANSAGDLGHVRANYMHNSDKLNAAHSGPGAHLIRKELQTAQQKLNADHNKTENDLMRKNINRSKGIKKAVDKLTKEEIEHLEEISKKTLGSYISKASYDLAKSASENGRDSTKTDTESRIKANKSFVKGTKRLQGINKAATKLTKEEIEHLEELSKETLKSYAKKANASLNDINDKINKNEDDSAKSTIARADTKDDNRKLSKKFFKRAASAHKAIDKLKK